MKAPTSHITRKVDSHNALPKRDTDGFGEPVRSFSKGSSLASDSYRKTELSNKTLPSNELWDRESLVDQRVTGHDVRFRFTGKERDEATGFDYFGARYYNSDLSIWLSAASTRPMGGMDPLADKYPSMSPFMYTAGNPVMLVDPDGKNRAPSIHTKSVQSMTSYGEFKRAFYGSINYRSIKNLH